ncbi:IS3 family transposase [Thalassobacillus devorans]|uniref:IS3 family transposase n=1 Tax=Thalassobacillus devorans TaxID=279813 RepID=UPI00048AD6D1|nr:IS3 family transposase [Thalassobacillus devorans]
MDVLRGTYTIEELCAYLSVSRSGYHKYRARRKCPDKDRFLRNRIWELYEAFDHRFGYRRIQDELIRQDQWKVNHKKVYRLMDDMNLKAKIRRKHNSKLRMKKVMKPYIADNVLEQNFQAEKPNEKWVTDITYIIVGQEHRYLSAIMDLYTKEIIAYQISDSYDLTFVLDTVKEAVHKETDAMGPPILHSDRGAQYTSEDYHNILADHHITPSMSGKGNCFDNACIESFFSHLKVEALYYYPIADIDEAQRITEEYIYFYNHQRAQRKLNRLTPVEYRNQAVA